MKALQIGMHWFPERPGGLDRMFYCLAQALPAAGCEFVGLVAGSEQVAATTHGKIQAFCAADCSVSKRVFKSRIAIKRRLQEERPDVIAAHFALYVVGALDIISDYPFVTHFHGPWAAESGVEKASAISVRLKTLVERLGYGRSDRLIVLSHAFAKVLSERYRIPRERIDVVPGCVDVGKFPSDISRAEARMRLNLPLDRPIILCVRRLVHRMGLDDLIAAMTSVHANYPEALLLIAGRGKLLEELRKRVSEAGLSDSVRLLGFVTDEDLPFFYRAADVSIVPSTALEGFGLTTVESLAAGTPVLVTPVGGLPEVVSALSDNLVLPDSGAPAIAAALTDFMSGQLALPSDSECRSYAQSNFDLPVIAQKTKQVYLDAIKNR